MHCRHPAARPGRTSPISELVAEDRAEVAYRGHFEALKRDLTVAENLAFHAALWGREAAFDGVLAELKLDKVAHMRARYLSAGQRRRVALAMLQLSGAKLWLMDEPTTNLDSEGRALLVEWTRRHLAGGGLAVIATHQPDEFATQRRIDDRVVMSAFNACSFAICAWPFAAGASSAIR